MQAHRLRRWPKIETAWVNAPCLLCISLQSLCWPISGNPGPAFREHFADMCCPCVACSPACVPPSPISRFPLNIIPRTFYTWLYIKRRFDWTDVDLMVVQRRRRWATIKTTLVHYFVYWLTISMSLSPIKHDTLCQFWFNAGSPSATLDNIKPTLVWRLVTSPPPIRYEKVAL